MNKKQMSHKELVDYYFMQLVNTGNYDDWKNKDVFDIAENMALAYKEGVNDAN